MGGVSSGRGQQWVGLPVGGVGSGRGEQWEGLAVGGVSNGRGQQWAGLPVGGVGSGRGEQWEGSTDKEAQVVISTWINSSVYRKEWMLVGWWGGGQDLGGHILGR